VHTFAALEVRLLHEMRDARRHAVDVVERLDAAFHNRILTTTSALANQLTTHKYNKKLTSASPA
jgi:hypothetical protein